MALLRTPEHLSALPQSSHDLSENRVHHHLLDEGSFLRGLDLRASSAPSLCSFKVGYCLGEYKSLGGSVFLIDICLSFEAFFPFWRMSPGSPVTLVRRMNGQG